MNFMKFMVTGRRIIKELRGTIMVVDENGKVERFRRASPIVRRRQARRAPARRTPTRCSPPRRIVGTQRRRVTTPKQLDHTLQALSNSLPQCSVEIQKMTEVEIAGKIAKIEREGKVRKIEEKIKTLPRKKVLCEFSLTNFS